jgi:hypothetical protein
MALREGESEVGAGARHDYLIHETIESILRCRLCAEQIRTALLGAAPVLTAEMLDRMLDDYYGGPVAGTEGAWLISQLAPYLRTTT